MTFISKQSFRAILKWSDQKQIANLEKTIDKVASDFKFTRVATDLLTATSI